MPKTQDLHNLKTRLQEQIAAAPGMVAEERQKLERRIARLDSVDKMMMDWMHHFNLPDSMTDEAKREYLESQMEKVKQVREAILEAIASEKGSN
jgi:anti-sigma-K factor RskA